MIVENVSLKPYNTFGVEAQTRYFAEVSSVSELEKILVWYRQQRDCPLLILGGGSNLLFTRDWDGLVLKINFSGLEIVEEGADEVLVSAQAGTPWHEFVLWTLEHGFNGLENLSLIPGQVGTAPIQNIGAYGVEIKDVFASLEALNIHTGQWKTFSREACQFGYRDSVFKQKERGQWIIVSVSFMLSKSGTVEVNYGTIQTVLAAHNINTPTPKQVSQAVTAIRQSKLPDPKQIGSAGSFFKNPIVKESVLKKIQAQYPAVPNYKMSEENQFKIPAGWLIEKAGWKGKRLGAYGVHDKQALVLVNFGGATGQAIWALAQDIQVSVHTQFGIILQPEVNVI